MRNASYPTAQPGAAASAVTPAGRAHHRARAAAEVAVMRAELAAFAALVERHGLVAERRAFARLTSTTELADTMRRALEAGRRALHEADRTP